MRNKTIAIFSLFILTVSNAQQGRVGINTLTPSSTLDIRGKSDITDITGVQAPRLTRAELTAKGDSLYGQDQKGCIIYITDVTGGDNNTQRVNIKDPGYYYFDGSFWQEITTSGWKLTGNKGTNPAVNFIGTTDVMDVVFKIGGLKSGLLSTVSQNTAFGMMTLLNSTTANTDILANAAYGAGALANLTKGQKNTAIGVGSMFSSIANLNENTAVGQGALALASNAAQNTVIGVNAGGNLISGNNNTALGNFTWFNNANGSNQINIANSIFGINAAVSPSGANSSIGINIENPNSTLQVNGSISYNITEIDNATTQAQIDLAFSKASTIILKRSITLPDPTTCKGRIYNLVYDSGTVIITNTILDAGNPVTGYILNSTAGSKRITVQSTGDNWYIIASS